MWVYPGEMLTQPHFTDFARIFVGLILLTAGITKLFDRRNFVEIVRGYQLVRDNVAPLFAKLLPLVELMVGVNLLLGTTMPWSSLLAAVLFVMFSAAVAINLWRGRRDIECGCFGIRRNQKLSWALVFRNLIFAALALFSATVETGSRPMSARVNIAVVLLASGTLLLWSLLRVLVQFRRLLHQSLKETR